MTSAKRNDALTIQTEVLQEIRRDGRLDPAEIGVEVSDGVVMLSGIVNSWEKRQAAQEAAHRVEGVLDVVNDIQVVLPGSAGWTDVEIARQVRRALELDPRVPHERIHTTVSQGTVTLEGKVDHLAQRLDAERAVRALECVRAVDNRLTVEPAVNAGTVRVAIEAALARHALHDARHVDINVEDGVVTLAGSVHSAAEHRAIVGAVRAIRGVRAVDDRLREMTQP